MTRYVIERRHADGSLDLQGRQPDEIFGRGAFEGVTEWQLSRAVLAHAPQRFDSCHASNIALWPSFIDPWWIARERTWP